MTDEPTVISTKAGVQCFGCGRIVGTYANGKIRPHYAATGEGLCSGAYTIPTTAKEAGSV